MNLTVDSSVPSGSGHRFVVKVSDVNIDLSQSTLQVILCVVNALNGVVPVSYVVFNIFIFIQRKLVRGVRKTEKNWLAEQEKNKDYCDALINICQFLR